MLSTCVLYISVIRARFGDWQLGPTGRSADEITKKLDGYIGLQEAIVYRLEDAREVLRHGVRQL